MKALLIILCVALGAGMAYVRLAPADPSVWHRDPLLAPSPERNGYLVRPGENDAAVFALPAEALLAALNDIALATARTKILAGSVESGMITYVTRSRVWGFPDYTTVKALPLAEGQSSLAIYGRQRFGRSDFGVNRARVSDWLQRLQSVAQPGG